MKTFFTGWKAAFVAGLAVLLPATVAAGLVMWIFGLVFRFTNALLVFVPPAWMQEGGNAGPVGFHWSLLALAVALVLVSLVGGVARYYFGRKLIKLADALLMRVPLFNKLYGMLKRVNEALTANQAKTFKQVVLVEFPRPGLYAIGFLTSVRNDEAQARSGRTLVSVFVPASPLTSGSVVLVPEADVIKLEMSVAQGIKFIMSLGAVSPAGQVVVERKELRAPDSSRGNDGYALLKSQAQ